MSYEGSFRQADVLKGRNRDTVYFAAIDKEWPQLKRCFEKYLSERNFNSNGEQIVSLSLLTREILHRIDPELTKTQFTK